jgi:hypothetical protein
MALRSRDSCYRLHADRGRNGEVSSALRLSLLMPLLAATAAAQDVDRQERWRERSEQVEAEGLAEPFRGIAVGGEIREGLFPVRTTGVSTAPVREAALAFLDSLDEGQRARTEFAVDDAEWRKWRNQHAYRRQGTGFYEMTPAQRELAIGLLRASLSAKGLQLTRDIMRLNHTLGELNADNFDEYGEWLYWLTVMGTPSASKPWGWQLDGHHAIINYFVLGDQVVMSPAFFGSEPVVAEAGKYAGTRILLAEQDQALAFLHGLSSEQRAKAVLDVSKDGNNNVAEAFRDNIDLDYVGLPASELGEAQREQLLSLVGLYVGNMDAGHAAVKMDEVRAHLDETWFAWIGGGGDDAVFYYRILSPVVLIEFDHQRPANLRHLHPPVPNRQHIHTVIRTPNGNDYGKDLLRQHHAEHAH